jgi:hypothetical protein
MADGEKGERGKGEGKRGRPPKRPRGTDSQDDDGTPENWEEDDDVAEDVGAGANAEVESALGAVENDAVPESIKKYVRAMIKEHTSVKSRVDRLTAANKRLENKVKEFKSSDEHKKLGYDVDLATIKKKVAQLPPDGDIGGFLYETSLGASVATAKSMGDDSFNASFINRLSVEAKLDSTSFEAKRVESAPGHLKFSQIDFLGPAGNGNWMNVRESCLTEYENQLLDIFPLIEERAEVLKAYKKVAGGSVSQQTVEGQFKEFCLVRGVKWDSDFVRDAPFWDGNIDFEDYFLSLWRVARFAKLEDPMLFKDVLYNRIFECKGKKMGRLITPEANASLSALGYYLLIRRLVIPFADTESATEFFYALKQKSGQNVDVFFNEKLRLFRLMHPGHISKQSWRDFYNNVAKNLMFTDLARDMANFVESMHYLEDYSSFLTYLIRRGQHYISWARSGHISPENVTSCYSQAMEGLKLEESREVKSRPVISEVHVSDLADRTGTGDNNAWIEGKDDIPWDQVENVIGALNSKAKNMICWYCGKEGHIVADCWQKRDGKPPAPDSRIGKTKAKFFPVNNEKGEGPGVPNNRVIPEQFLKKSVNQRGPAVDSEKSRDEKQYEAMIAEMARFNYQ